MSIFDHPDSVRPAPSWRCPACRTLQPETTRCWRCDKPAFTCETCYFYRASVATDLGRCANDPAGTPLHADEVRGCWVAPAASRPGTASALPVVQAPGLFAEAEIAPPLPAEPPPPTLSTTQDRARRRAKPALEAPGRAAWAEPGQDVLVEAPKVDPGKRITTEVQRRRRRWFR